MSLLQTKQTPPAEEIAQRIAQTVNRAFENMIHQHTSLYREFWQSDAATPDEIAAELGTSGAAFWVAAGVSSQAIAATCQHLGLDFETVLPAQYRVPPREVAINQDGTLTIAPAE
jgi:hypothetical protein